MTTYCPQSIDRLRMLKISKADYLKQFKGQFDYALPQPWLNAFTGWCELYRPAVTYDLILSTTVMRYDDQFWGHPMTICTEVKRAWDAWDKFAS